MSGGHREADLAARQVRAAVSRALPEATDALVLVACSGGPDSLAMAAAASDLSKRRSLHVGAVLIDHGLQPGSDTVAATAAKQCEDLGLSPVVVESVEVVVTGSGLEAAARDARYAALEQVADRVGAVAVLLGHTLDDQAETVLLGLARGSGIRSLSGMPERRGVFVRPLLGLRRDLVAASLPHWGLEAWLDPHNEDQSFARVRVRRVVMPVLEQQLGPGIAEALARTARLARMDADVLDEWAVREFDALNSTGWGVGALADLSAAIRGRVIRTRLIDKGCPEDDLTAAHVAEVDRLITDWHGQGPLTLPGAVTATRGCGKLLVYTDSGEPH
ncbi:MAG: tRNA lysidine(34) synthetase TilS [Candidatus Nanopelagicales bacterium]|nr:tRNA lysidine(34) synthetase TilS [Candidatus Nanopelagicales bacterium]MDZ4250250.1 tRNA lysidine(34) synthetase TilS [Candidatus Nanopelagicales bacterium]